MDSEMQALLNAATYNVDTPNVGLLLTAITTIATQDTPSTNAKTDTAEMATDVKKLMDIATARRAEDVPVTETKRASGIADSNSNVGDTLLRTAAMVTGVGPIVTGLLKLFGSSDPEPVAPLEKFSAPASISVEAGLTGDRSFSSLRYAQGGIPESTRPEARPATPSLPTIQVNVQAMDSQSFLDRQDDIARAVREAMLHSNSLNDVVLEL